MVKTALALLCYLISVAVFILSFSSDSLWPLLWGWVAWFAGAGFTAWDCLDEV